MLIRPRLNGRINILMYEIHVQRGREISARAAAVGRPSYIDIIVIALLGNARGRRWWRVRVSRGCALQRGVSERASERGSVKADGGEGSRRHYAKEMVSSVIPGSRWPEVVALQTHPAELFLQDCPQAMDGSEPVAHQSLMDVQLYWKGSRTPRADERAATVWPPRRLVRPEPRAFCPARAI